MLLHVWVAHVQVTALAPCEVDSGLLLFEVDVAFIADNSFGLVQRLGESTCASEGVGASRGAHVSVLALECLSVNCDGTGLRVVALGDSLAELIVSCLCNAAVHSSLHNEVLVTVAVWHELTVLSLHDFTTDSVLSQVLRHEVLSVSRIEVTLLVFRIEISLSLGHLLGDLALNIALHHHVLAASTSNTISLVLSSAVLCVVSRHDLLIWLAIDSLLSVIEDLTLDWALKVEVLLGDVRFSNSPEQ